MEAAIRSILSGVMALLLAIGWSDIAQAQAEPPLEEENTPVEAEAGALSFDGAVYAFDPSDQNAPAWSWIDARLDDTQFLLIGEQHYVDGIALSTQTAFQRYVGDGFGTLVLEASPFLGRTVRESGPDAVLVPYPYELAFGVDGMVRLIETAHALAPDPSVSVYGIDQPVTAIHSFDHLGQTLSGDHARRMARGLSLKAALQAGEYLRVDHEEDFRALRSAAGAELDETGALLLDELELSMEIYTAFRAARRGEGPRGLSDAVREAFMGEQLDLILTENGPDTRAIILMGGAHIMRGIGPNGVETLGQHAADIAADTGRSSLHIGMRRSVADQAFPPADLFADNDAILIDTRAVLDVADPTTLAALDADVIRDLQGFDALVYLRDAPRESFAIMGGREASFRRGVITTLITGAIAAVIGLLAVITLAVQGVRMALGKPGSGQAVVQWSPLAVLSVGMTTVLVLQILALLEPGNRAAMADAGAMNGAVLAVCAIIAAGLAVVSVFQRWFSVPVRIIYALSALGLIALAVWMRHWNLGGML